MANPQEFERDFPNNPHPIPEPPSIAVAPASVTAPDEGGGGGTAVAVAPPPAIKESAADYFVAPDEQGRQRIYATDKENSTTDFGWVNIGDSDALLHARGQFNPSTGNWKIDAKLASELKSGDMSFDEYIPAKYQANKAVIARGLIWTDWLRGNTTLEEAQGRGDLEALKMQIKEAPLFVWQGDISKTIAKMWREAKEAGATGIARRVAGETAGQAAFLTDAPMAAAVGIGLVAPIIATRGAAAAAVVPVVASFLENGLVFKRSYEIEGGNAASEMIAKGFDEATVKKYAPLVGIMNGALETLGFHMIPAPYKRVLAGKVLNSPAVKKVLTNAYVSYMKELGTEVATEVAQEAVNVYAENMAAETDARPELRVTGEQALNRYADIALKTLAGTAGLKAPGLALEVGVQRADTKAEIKAAAETTKILAERQKTLAAETAVPVTPAAAVEAAISPEVKSQAQQLEELGVQVDTGKISPDEFVQQADKLVSEVTPPPAEAAPVIPRGKEKPVALQTQELEIKARVNALTSDLQDTRTLIDELSATRARFAKNKLSTRLLDTKIGELLTKEQGIQEDLQNYTKPTIETTTVLGKERISMQAASLENIIETGFKEGRKEVIKVRAGEIKSIAAEAKLTQGDIRLLLKDKNIGLMGDVEFRHFLNGYENAKGEHVAGFKEKIAAHVERKTALKTVRKTLKEKQIKRESNIRALHELPAVGKMTTKQLNDYVGILSSYDAGAVALTPTRIKALETTKLAGAKTMQDVLALAAKTLNKPLADLVAARKGQFDPLRGDTELAESQPVYAFAVDEVQTAEIRGDAKFQAFEQVNHRLGAEAAASRVGFADVRRLVPSMPEVMAHLEADPVEVYAGVTILPEITPAEQAYVDFLREAFAYARDYLFKTGELESTRFEKTYAPHTRRSVAEILVGIKDTGIKAALGEFFDNVFAFQEELGGPDTGGPALGLRKFFKQTLFRTGEMTPSTNVIKSTTSYFKQFFRKQALDEAIPTVDTVIEALRVLEQDQSEEGQNAQKALGNFIKTYLNNKKGINASMDAIAPRGGLVDAAIRFVSGWISLAYIGGNMALQLTAPVGETLASFPLLGARGVTLGKFRLIKLMASAEGRAILKKYEYFTGKGGLEMLMEPGKNIDERAGVLLYGLLQAGRTHTLQTVLLASMTDAEFKAGEISAGRLAEIKVLAGRWMDIPGMKSVVGSTSVGAAATKFRGWMLPILRTTTQDIGSLLNSLGAKIPGTKPLNARQISELYRIAEATVAVTALAAALGEVDKKDDSFLAQLKRKLLSEMFSLTQIFDPKIILTAGPVVAFLTQLGVNLSMLAHLETYKTGEKEGELKAPAALAKQLPLSALVRTITPKESK